MVRRFLHLGLVLLSGALIVGCAAGPSPVTGTIYTDVKASHEVTSNTGSSKRGTASCTSILGAVGEGDCSIGAAMKDGGITKVQRVDYETKSILGIYAKTTTIVIGE